MRAIKGSPPRALSLVLAALLLVSFAIAGTHTAGGQTPNPALIDRSTGTLIVEKSPGDPLTQYNEPGGTRYPLDGIRVVAQRIVSVDLTTTQGWIDAQAMNVEEFYRGGSRESELSDPVIAVTDTNGVATFENLPIGLYYITEDPTTTQPQNPHQIKPFVVTIPTSYDGGRSWNYTVRVHAKDQQLQAAKAASHRCVGVRGEITYGVTGRAPAADRNGSISRFELVDPLQDGLEYLRTRDVTILDETTGEKWQLVPGTDFEILQGDGNVVTMRLLAPGRAVLADSRKDNPRVSATWRFVVRVHSKPDDGRFRNVAYLLTASDPDFDRENPPGVPTNEVITRVPCDPGMPTPDPSDPGVPVTPPGTPGTPSTPGQSSVPPGGDTPITTNAVLPPGQSDPPSRPGLAMTGAAVVQFLILGVILVGLGALLLRRDKRGI